VLLRGGLVGVVMLSRQRRLACLRLAKRAQSLLAQ
jgi:hypothetical protein